jgi:hypothetical protein
MVTRRRPSVTIGNQSARLGRPFLPRCNVDIPVCGFGRLSSPQRTLMAGSPRRSAFDEAGPACRAILSRQLAWLGRAREFTTLSSAICILKRRRACLMPPGLEFTLQRVLQPSRRIKPNQAQDHFSARENRIQMNPRFNVCHTGNYALPANVRCGASGVPFTISS